MRFPGNLITRLEQGAATSPERPAFNWWTDDGTPCKSLSYQDLWSRATNIAGHLQRDYARGDRALLLFPPGLELIEAFFGCLSAGLIAVPVCPPRRFRPSIGIDGIVKNAAPAAVLTTAELASNRELWFGKIPALHDRSWLAVDAALNSSSQQWFRPDIEANTIALLQYTSGTTGAPKGVMVSHGNLLHNAATIRRAFGPDEHLQRAFWLPMYHDMGLIGAMLQTVFDGATSSWISPAAFLQRPLRWLELISETRASISGAPDFAYNYCVERSKAEQRQGLDLSSWKVAVSGAETIRPATIDRFSEAFAACGFRRSAFQPGYGLAEATLVVSHESHETDPTTIYLDSSAISRNEVKACDQQDTNARPVASSGAVSQGQCVAIVDVTTEHACGDDRVGEIWVSGPNVAAGYYNDPTATARSFQAKLAGDSRDYLRTGDLGFLRDGHLYVTGRKKELIVVRGRNLYPADLEWAVRQADPRVRKVANAVFSVELLGSERLVVVQEVERAHRKTDFEDLGQIVRRKIGQESGAEVFDLLFVNQGAIPKTTSGKIRRLQCREDYLAECYETIARWTDRRHDPTHTELHSAEQPSSDVTSRSTDEIHTWLLDRIARQLDVNRDRLDDRLAFFEMGLGSLEIVLICDEFEQWLGQRMPPTMIYNYPTITALAERLGQHPPEEVLSITTPLETDALRSEVAQATDDELTRFIESEMLKSASFKQKRVA